MSSAGLFQAPVPVTARAPAKVNLHLAVGALRPDGFHGLTTVYQAVSLYDEVVASPADQLAVTINGEGVGTLPTDRRNLAARAAIELAAVIGVEPLVHLEITKVIPVAAGLAGGSADAAATLVACDAMWGSQLDRGALLALAASLGSDVPFALTGGTALGTGRGEDLSPVLTSDAQWHWVLAVADGGLSTPAVYAELDRKRGTDVMIAAGSTDDLLAALRLGDPALLGRLLANDLQPAALSMRPDLRRTLAAGEELGAVAGIVSGSGPTCAFLTASREDAVRLAAALGGEGVCRTVRTVHGPVPGARVVAAVH